jgi:uncharacterized protein (TIGR03435 family)
MRTRLAAAVGLALLTINASAQTSDGPRFEVASISAHVDDGSTISGYADNPASVRMTNMSLRALIRIAYGVLDAQLDAPGWLASSSFDIVAKPPDGYDARQLPVMVRNLLADRFKLVVHRERKEIDAFALRVIATGLRWRVSSDRSFLTARAGLVSGNGRSIAELAGFLAQTVSAPVVDQTGLTGSYDLQLEWSPLSAGSGDTGVSLFTALREQAGLRLDSVKSAVDVVVIDRIERNPTEN